MEERGTKSDLELLYTHSSPNPKGPETKGVELDFESHSWLVAASNRSTSITGHIYLCLTAWKAGPVSYSSL